jgi:hypothetical protein
MMWSNLNAQTNCDSIKLPSEPYICNWKFFQLKDSITGTILSYSKDGTCEVMASASIAIIKSFNDTIRVLSLCDERDFKGGQKVIVSSEAPPSFFVNIPVTMLYNEKRSGKGKTRTRQRQKKEDVLPNCDYDRTVSKTTWGSLTIHL